MVVNKAMVDEWSDGVFKYLEAEVPNYQQLVKDPRRIFNADESGFPLCFKTGKVLAQTGARHVYHVSSSSKQQITIMVSFNAFCEFAPSIHCVSR